MKISKWFILSSVSLGSFAMGINASIVRLANPTLVRTFQIGMEKVQWVSTIYMLVVISLLVMFGRIGDQTGNHRIYTGGLVVFILGALFCGVSGSFSVLLIARVVQALGSAMLMSNSMAIISGTFPPEERGRALGISVVAVGLGNMCGPSLGGLILHYFSWNAIFFVSIPIGLLALIFCLKLLRSGPVKSKETHLSLDPIGSALLTGIIISFILSISGGFAGSGWLIFLVVGLLPVFILFEKSHKDPLINIEVLRITRFSLGNLLTFILYFTQTLVSFLLPFYLSDIIGITVATTGLMMMAMPLFMAIVSPVAGTLSDRIGAPLLMLLAFFAMFGAFVCLSMLSASSPLWYIAIGVSLTGVGVGLCGAPNNSEVLTAAGSKYSGYAGGFIATMRNLAMCIGTAVSAGGFSSLRTLFSVRSSGDSAYMSALRCIIALAALFALIGIFICFKLKRSTTAS